MFGCFKFYKLTYCLIFKVHFFNFFSLAKLSYFVNYFLLFVFIVCPFLKDKYNYTILNQHRQHFF